MQGPVEGEIVMEPQVVSLDAATRAEIDIQVATAKRYPRDIARVARNLLAYVTVDEETAASCFYKLPRKGEGGKPVEGASVRMAELAMLCYGNCRVMTRSAGESEDGRAVRQVGLFWDLETNAAIQTEVSRRITTRDGKRYSDDMIGVTRAAADAIARRNAILALLRPFTREAYLRAKELALGKTKSLGERRKEVISRLRALSPVITVERILAVCGKTSVDVLDWEDMENLIGLGTAIKEGHTTVEEAFPDGAAAPVATKDIVPPPAAESAGNAPQSAGGEPPVEREPGADDDEGGSSGSLFDAPPGKGKK